MEAHRDCRLGGGDEMGDDGSLIRIYGNGVYELTRLRSFICKNGARKIEYVSGNENMCGDMLTTMRDCGYDKRIGNLSAAEQLALGTSDAWR